jgi:hypothetical protein
MNKGNDHRFLLADVAAIRQRRDLTAKPQRFFVFATAWCAPVLSHRSG